MRLSDFTALPSAVAPMVAFARLEGRPTDHHTLRFAEYHMPRLPSMHMDRAELDTAAARPPAAVEYAVRLDTLAPGIEVGRHYRPDGDVLYYRPTPEHECLMRDAYLWPERPGGSVDSRPPHRLSLLPGESAHEQLRVLRYVVTALHAAGLAGPHFLVGRLGDEYAFWLPRKGTLADTGLSRAAARFHDTPFLHHL